MMKMTINQEDKRMKHFHFIGLAAMSLGLLVSSCQEAREQDPGRKESVQPVAESRDTITFTAVLDQNGTKTSLGADLSVFWSAGDHILVSNGTTWADFELIGGEGTDTGTFQGPDLEGSTFYAIYPAVEGWTGPGSAFSLADTQQLSAGSFGPGANLAAAKASSLNDLVFYNMLGALSITLNGTPTVTEIKITTKGDEVLAPGNATIDFTGDRPGVSFTPAANDAKSVKLSSAAGITLSGEGTTFYAVLPAGTLAGGFSIEVTDTDGDAMIRHAAADNNNEVLLSQVRAMPALTYTPRYKADFLQATDVGACTHTLAGDSEYMLYACSYTEGYSQYAYKNTAGTPGSRYLRIEDWDEEYMLAFTMPYDLPEGKNIQDVKIEATGNTGSIASGTGITLRVVKKANGLVWLSDPETGNGYILMMED